MEYSTPYKTKHCRLILIVDGYELANIRIPEHRIIWEVKRIKREFKKEIENINNWEIHKAFLSNFRKLDMIKNMEKRIDKHYSNI